MSKDPNRNLDKNHDQLNKKSSVSPDSTVSVLLTSIGSSNSCSCSLIQYKDKLYSSASEALQAYIEDFDLSLTSSEITTGKICLCQSTPKPAEFSKRHVKGKHSVFSASTSFNKFWCFLVVFFVCLFPSVANGFATPCLMSAMFWWSIPCITACKSSWYNKWCLIMASNICHSLWCKYCIQKIFQTVNVYSKRWRNF